MQKRSEAMMRHRVIVSTTAPAAIRREEYERALHRFRHVRMPIEQTPQYRMISIDHFRGACMCAKRNLR